MIYFKGRVQSAIKEGINYWSFLRVNNAVGVPDILLPSCLSLLCCLYNTL